MLDKLPSLISLLGVFILGASVSYDFGFFYVLDTNFSEMPTTLSDHLRSSLNWIPLAIISIFVLFIYEMFSRRIEQGMSEDEIVQTSRNPKRVARFRDSTKYIPMLIVAIPILKLSFNLDIAIREWGIYLLFSWILFFRFVFGHEKIRQQTSDGFLVASCFTPIVLIVCSFLGIGDAQEITRGGGTQYVFVLRETQRETQIVGTLARSFEKYHLIWDKNEKEIRLVNVSEVVQLYPQSKTANSDQKSPSTSR
ncbi:hypothetical protein [Candidatus Spongiihabitans sp.]|uniref:hypothetical protein n=1 Tax=Candidatus Spongiihabitans sp. TaxID=3101308 RepID=UPI003C7DA877